MMIAARASFGCVSHCGSGSPEHVQSGAPPQQQQLIGP